MRREAEPEIGQARAIVRVPETGPEIVPAPETAADPVEAWVRLAAALEQELAQAAVAEDRAWVAMADHAGAGAGREAALAEAAVDSAAVAAEDEEGDENHETNITGTTGTGRRFFTF